nr:hypothetical protein [Dongia deserti]
MSAKRFLMSPSRRVLCAAELHADSSIPRPPQLAGNEAPIQHLKLKIMGQYDWIAKEQLCAALGEIADRAVDDALAIVEDDLAALDHPAPTLDSALGRRVYRAGDARR